MSSSILPIYSCVTASYKHIYEYQHFIRLFIGPCILDTYLWAPTFYTVIYKHQLIKEHWNLYIYLWAQHFPHLFMSTSTLFTYLWTTIYILLFMSTSVLDTYLWRPVFYTRIYEHQKFTHLFMSINLLYSTYLWVPVFYTPIHQHQHFIGLLTSICILDNYFKAPAFYTSIYEYQNICVY